MICSGIKFSLFTILLFAFLNEGCQGTVLRNRQLKGEKSGKNATYYKTGKNAKSSKSTRPLSNDALEQFYEIFKEMEKEEKYRNFTAFANDYSSPSFTSDNSSVTSVGSPPEVTFETGPSQNIRICHTGFTNGDAFFPVFCWDDDNLDRDDFIGATVVPNNGCANLSLIDLPWDLSFGSWRRADVYCNIYYEGKTLTTQIQDNVNPRQGLTIKFDVPDGKSCVKPTPYNGRCCQQCRTYSCLVNAGGIDDRTPCNPPFTWPVCDGNGCTDNNCRNCRCELMTPVSMAAILYDITTNALFYAEVRNAETPNDCLFCGNFKSRITASVARSLPSTDCESLS